MIKGMVFLASIFASMFVVADCSAVSDDLLENRLRTLFLDHHAIDGRLCRVLEEVNFASNRLVAVAKRIYESETTDVGQKGRAISVYLLFLHTVHQKIWTLSAHVQRIMSFGLMLLLGQ